jgi:hypothetical protein
VVRDSNIRASLRSGSAARCERVIASPGGWRRGQGRPNSTAQNFSVQPGKTMADCCGDAVAYGGVCFGIGKALRPELAGSSPLALLGGIWRNSVPPPGTARVACLLALANEPRNAVIN